MTISTLTRATSPDAPQPPDRPPAMAAGLYGERIAAGLLALAIGGQAVDVMLAKGAFDIILNINETIDLAVAIAVSVIGAITALEAGIEMAAGHRVKAGVAGGGWAFIGIGMAYLRWNASALASTDSGGTPAADHVLAVLMLALYLAAGVTIAFSAAKLWHPDRRALRASRRTIAHKSRKLGPLEAVYTRVSLLLATSKQERTAYATQRDHALEQVNALERELKAHARDRIALALANPRATGLIRADHQPQPRPAED